MFRSTIGPLGYDLWASKVGVLEGFFKFFCRLTPTASTERFSTTAGPICTQFGQVLVHVRIPQKSNFGAIRLPRAPVACISVYVWPGTSRIGTSHTTSEATVLYLRPGQRISLQFLNAQCSGYPKKYYVRSKSISRKTSSLKCNFWKCFLPLL